MACVRVIALLFLAATSSNALICKNCNVHDCENPETETCLQPGDDYQVGCLTETFKFTGEDKLQYQRKCVLYQKGGKFECPDYPNYESLSCVVCDTDLCNGAPSIGGSLNRTTTKGNFTSNNTNINSIPVIVLKQ